MTVTMTIMTMMTTKGSSGRKTQQHQGHLRPRGRITRSTPSRVENIVEAEVSGSTFFRNFP